MALTDGSGSGLWSALGVNRNRQILIADSVAVALAASIPWSTTATGILAVAWLVAFIPTVDRDLMRNGGLDVLRSAAGGLPALLFALGAVGMLWADVSFAERWTGFQPFPKLLFIPLLMVHFLRSERGDWVLIGFLASCGALLAISWLLFIYPNLHWDMTKRTGIPVKDHLSQSAMFIICTAALADLSLRAWQEGRGRLAAAYALAAAVFAENIFFIAASRTALVILPILLLLLGWRWLGWKGAAGLVIALAIMTVLSWMSSSYLQLRVGAIWPELHAYATADARTSIGERIEFWKKSVRFVAQAPLIGHGTGTIPDRFRRVAAGGTGASSLVAANPHNQVLGVAIQLGLVGALVLCAMWIAHLLLFRGEGLLAWIGLAIVVQNVVGSLFNSHLFDFTHGWAYAIGVGVIGGMVLKDVRRVAGATAGAAPGMAQPPRPA